MGWTWLFRSAPILEQVCRKNVPGLPKPGGLATGIGHIGPRLEQVTSIPADRRQNSRKPATKSTQTGDGKDRQGRSGVVSPGYLCDLKTFGKQSIDGLSPEESWLYLLKNMANFAGKPEEMGTKYAVVAEASRMYHLPDKEQIQYLFAMVSEHEKLDIGTAYYKDGFLDGHKLGKEEGRVEGRASEKDAIARTMLAKGLPVALIIECTGLTEDEVKLIGAKKEELQ